MADDKIANLRSNLVEQGLMGEFEDHVEINRQGKVIPLSERMPKKEEESETSQVSEVVSPDETMQKKGNSNDSDFLKDSCVVS
jgi:hypothetical protein